MESNKPKEVVLDMEIVSSLIGHIEEPCEDGKGNNVRSVYLREAKRLLPTIQNPFAKEMLEAVIKKYDDKS